LVKTQKRQKTALAILAALTAAALAVCAGCSSGMKPPRQEPAGEQVAEFDPFSRPPGEQDYLVKPGDSIRVHFLYNPELNVDGTTVRSDGKISLPVIGDILVAGKTAGNLTEEVRADYGNYISSSGHGRVLRAGDELQIRFTYNPQLNQRAYVRPDGKLSLLLLGELQADGVEFSRFEEKVKQGYAEFIKEPEISIYLLSTPTKKIYTDVGDITVMVAGSRPKQVFVGGEVKDPKLIEFRDTLTPLQAVYQAGGILESGSLGNVILLTRGNDGGALAAKINLAAYMKSGVERTDLFLRDGDVLIVPRTGIAKVNLIIKQYVRDLLPLESSFSFSYLINQDWWVK
jgi:protein involved in polysaccharide export with SLBB domain